MEDHYTHNHTDCDYAIDMWDTSQAAPLNLSGTFGDFIYVNRTIETIQKHDQSKPLFFYLALQVRAIVTVGRHAHIGSCGDPSIDCLASVH